MAGELAEMAATELVEAAVKNPKVAAACAVGTGVIALGGYIIYELSPAIRERIANCESFNFEASYQGVKLSANGHSKK